MIFTSNVVITTILHLFHNDKALCNLYFTYFTMTKHYVISQDLRGVSEKERGESCLDPIMIV